MYYITSQKRVLMEVEKALKTHFGDKVEIDLNEDKITITVKEGFEEVIKTCAPKMYGGGFEESLNEKTFTILIQ